MQQCFDHFKDRLVKAPILPYQDPVNEYILSTDASDHNMGAVLSQVQGGTQVVVAYYNKTFSNAKNNYCTTWKKLLAAAKAVKQF